MNRMEFNRILQFCILFSEKYWDFIDKYKSQDEFYKIESDIEKNFQPRRLKYYINLS